MELGRRQCYSCKLSRWTAGSCERAQWGPEQVASALHGGKISTPASVVGCFYCAQKPSGPREEGYWSLRCMKCLVLQWQQPEENLEWKEKFSNHSRTCVVDSKEGSGNCPLHGEVKRNECILVWCWLNPDTGLRQEVLVTSHVLLRKCFKTILNELSVCRQSVGQFKHLAGGL